MASCLLPWNCARAAVQLEAASALAPLQSESAVPTRHQWPRIASKRPQVEYPYSLQIRGQSYLNPAARVMRHDFLSHQKLAGYGFDSGNVPMGRSPTRTSVLPFAVDVPCPPLTRTPAPASLPAVARPAPALASFPTQPGTPDRQTQESEVRRINSRIDSWEKMLAENSRRRDETFE